MYIYIHIFIHIYKYKLQDILDQNNLTRKGSPRANKKNTKTHLIWKGNCSPQNKKRN